MTLGPDSPEATPSPSAAAAAELNPAASDDPVGIYRSVVFVLLVITVVSAVYTRSWSGWIAGSLTGFGAFAVGAIVGFLFGIPRASTTNSNPGNAGGPAFITNSNLVEISDWLTKILVGLGLVELGRASHGLGAMIQSVHVGLGGSTGASLVAAGLLLVGAIGGFMCSYLLTIIKGPGLFRRAAMAGIEQLVSKAQTAVTQAQAAAASAQSVRSAVESTVNDVQAQQLVHRQLDAATPPVDQGDLVAALQAANPETRQQLGILASQQRRFCRGNPERQAQHDRTVAVFQALATVDPNNTDNHAQLGFALGEQANPDLQTAISELNLAIKQRGSPTRPTDYFLELARAKYTIALLGDQATN